jgi:hypothetical protein
LVVPHRRATSLVATSSAANSNALAWVPFRCGNDVDRAQLLQRPALLLGHRHRRSGRSRSAAPAGAPGDHPDRGDRAVGDLDLPIDPATNSTRPTRRSRWCARPATTPTP